MSDFQKSKKEKKYIKLKMKNSVLKYVPKASATQIIMLILLICFTSQALGLNCYTDVYAEVKEDCYPHTGCMKKFNKETQDVIERSCFIVPKNDTCTTDSEGFGVCYCRTDLCNSADSSKRKVGWFRRITTLGLPVLFGAIALA